MNVAESNDYGLWSRACPKFCVKQSFFIASTKDSFGRKTDVQAIVQ